MSPAKAAPAVRFEATPYAIDGSTILRLPEKASNQLPSRGQVAVQATSNGHVCPETSGASKSREADPDLSAMIHLAHAVSQPLRPVGGEPRMTPRPRQSTPRFPAASRAIDAIIQAPGDGGARRLHDCER